MIRLKKVTVIIRDVKEVNDWLFNRREVCVDVVMYVHSLFMWYMCWHFITWHFTDQEIYFFAELEEEIVDLSSKHKFRKKEVSFWKKKNLRTENLRPQVPRFFLNRYKSNFTWKRLYTPVFLGTTISSLPSLEILPDAPVTFGSFPPIDLCLAPLSWRLVTSCLGWSNTFSQAVSFVPLSLLCTFR